MKRAYISMLIALTAATDMMAENKTVPNDTIKTYKLGEVVITSSTKETNDLRQFPGSVSILSPQTVNTYQINSLKDINALVPNLYMPNYGSKLTSAIYIRGIGARSSGQSIGLYVDNVPYLDKSSFDFEFNDIQRIEVLRGPQGTLYGRNAMGGIVNIYTLNPFDYQGTKVLLSGGNYGAVKAKVSTFQKLNNNFAFSVGGYYDRNDGFFMNEYTGKKADNEQSAGARVKLNWRNSKGWKAQYTANYDYVNQNAFPYGMYDTETKTVQPISINDPCSYWRNVFNNSLYLEWATNKFILSSTTSYQYLKDDMKMDQDYSPKSIFTLNQKQRQNGWSEEIAIRSNTKKNYQWSFGGYGFYNSLTTDGPVIFKEDGINDILQAAFDNLLKNNPRAPQLTVKGDDNNQIYFPGVFDTPTYGLAAFHQSTYNNLFIDGLSITAGIRLDYEKDKMTYDSSVEDMSIGVKMTMGQTVIDKDIPVTTKLEGKLKQDYLQLLPKVSLRYQCDPSTFTYLSVAKGYKSGGYNVQMFGDLVQAQAKYDLMSQFASASAGEPVDVEAAASYKPEFSWDYEMGIRSELVKNRLSAELTLFYMDIQDIQLTTFAETGSGRMITNGGRASSCGVELGTRARLAEGLTLDLNYGYTRAKFRDYEVKSSSDAEAVNYKDNYIPYTPRHTFSAAMQYTKLFRNSFVDQFTASAQFTGVGRIYWTEENNISQPFYGVLNAKVGVRKGIAQINLWTKNLTNTNYQAFYFESFNNSFIQKGRPLQIGAEIALSF